MYTGFKKNSAAFEVVKDQIMQLLTSRGREDLFQVWEDFLDTFPENTVDERVPFENIYKDIMDTCGGSVR
jgi:hypothetical protein